MLLVPHFPPTKGLEVRPAWMTSLLANASKWRRTSHGPHMPPTVGCHFTGFLAQFRANQAPGSPTLPIASRHSNQQGEATILNSLVAGVITDRTKAEGLLVNWRVKNTFENIFNLLSFFITKKKSIPTVTPGHPHGQVLSLIRK